MACWWIKVNKGGASSGPCETRDMPLRRPIPHCRPFATVHSPLILAKPPAPPPHTANPRPIDRFILENLANTPSAGRTALPQLIEQYLDRSGNVLDAQLPYEPHPSPSRRVSFSTDEGGDEHVHLIAHVVREGGRSKITVSSGFPLETSDGQPVLVTCAHTLEEVCRPPLCCAWSRIADVCRSVGLRYSSSLMCLTILHSPPYLTSLMRALRAHSSFPQWIQCPQLIPSLRFSLPSTDPILSYYPRSLCGHHSVRFQYHLIPSRQALQSAHILYQR